MNLQATGKSLRRWGYAYWFAPGCRWSYAFSRIALGCSLLWMTFLLFANRFADRPSDPESFLQQRNPAVYRPVGVLMVLGDRVPDVAFVNTLLWLSRVTACLVIVGLFTRVTLVVNLISLCLLAGLRNSFSLAWGHMFPVVLLPGIAMLFGPPSAFSIDAVLNRRRGRAPVGDDGRARRAVMLGQLALALVFFNAGMHKLFLGNQRLLAWTYSDNMRNVLLYQYWMLDEDLPPPLTFIATHSWAYKGVATANLICQFAPLLACCLVRRPILRALCGSLFLAEAIGLGVVMRIWNPYWCFLVAFFIDWDRLARWLASRRGSATGDSTPTVRLPRWLLLAQSLWVVLFVSFFIYVGFFQAGQRRYTFPFTAFPMYSDVKAERPFREHRAFPLYGSTWRIEADPPLTREQYLTVWRGNYALPWATSDLDAFVMQIKGQLETMYGTRISGIELEKTVFEIPPYPSLDVRPRASGLAYKYDRGRRWFFSGEVLHSTRFPDNPIVLQLQNVGLTDPAYRLSISRVPDGATESLHGQWHDGRFYFRVSTPGTYMILVHVRDVSLGDQEIVAAGAMVYR